MAFARLATRLDDGDKLVLTMPSTSRKRAAQSATPAMPRTKTNPDKTPPGRDRRAPTGEAETTTGLLAKTKADADVSVEDPYFSRAVGKSFLMLKLLSLADEPVTLNQMAHRAGLTKSSCFRLLHTLERLHFVTQSNDSRYVLTGRSSVASSTQITNALLRAPQEPLRSLNEEFGETVSIAVLFTNHIEVVHTLESPRMLRMANTVGRILPPHGSSLGKAITAFQPEELCRKLLVSYGLQRITPHTITDEMLLREEFDRIRRQGYAFEAEESTPDGCCFGAPIFVEGGKVPSAPVAALSISMPKSRVPQGEAREHMVQRLLAATQQVSDQLQQQINQFNSGHAGFALAPL